MRPRSTVPKAVEAVVPTACVRLGRWHSRPRQHRTHMAEHSLHLRDKALPLHLIKVLIGISEADVVASFQRKDRVHCPFQGRSFVDSLKQELQKEL
jgi:hypothetical protein